MTDRHLAQLNIGRLVADTDDPRVAEFMGALDRVNGLGKRMPGFVWMMEGSGEPGTGNTDAKIDGDPRFVSNLTVWQDVASLEIFNDPDYAGRLSIPDNVDDAYALAYLATGVTDWSDVTDAQFEAATDWLRGIHENLLTYWVDPAEIQQLMASGQVLAAWAWNEVPVALADQAFPVGFARNTDEGTSVWLCGYVNMAAGEGSEQFGKTQIVTGRVTQARRISFGHEGIGQHDLLAGEHELRLGDVRPAGDDDVEQMHLAVLPQQRPVRAEDQAGVVAFAGLERFFRNAAGAKRHA